MGLVAIPIQVGPYTHLVAIPEGRLYGIQVASHASATVRVAAPAKCISVGFEYYVSQFSSRGIVFFNPFSHTLGNSSHFDVPKVQFLLDTFTYTSNKIPVHSYFLLHNGYKHNISCLPDSFYKGAVT